MSTPHQETHIQLTHMKLAAKRWGSGKGPKILALHGWLDNLASFDTLAPLLGDFTLVAVDLPGHGLSDAQAPGRPYHFIDSVNDTIEMMDALEWEKCSLLGHSLGGAIGSIVAGTFPERIEKLALLESLGPLTQPEGSIPEQLRKHIAQWRSIPSKRLPIYSELEEATLARQKAGNLTLESAKILSERGSRQVKTGFTWRSDPRLKIPSHFRMSEPQVQAFLRKIDCPVLVIRADEGLPFSQEMIKSRLQCMRRVEYRQVPGGHHVHLDNPTAVVKSLNEFFEE